MNERKIINRDEVAIIGGAGFVGSRLKSRFIKGNIISNKYDIDLRNTSDECIYLDVEKVDSLAKLAGVNTIINLAAVHHDDIRPLSRYDDVNVQGAKNICEAASKYGIKKIIFTSSVAIYGFAPADTDESGDPNYFNDYGRTKYLAEQVYKKWQAEDPENNTLVIIRPTVIFGEGNRGNVFNLLNQIASGRFIMFGSGENIKSMAYVENVAAFIEHSLSFKEGIHIYNYIDKPDMNMNSLISHVRKVLFNKNNVGIRLPALLATIIGKIFDLLSLALNKKLPVSSIRIEKFLKTTKFSSSIEETGFIAPHTLNEALERTIRYEFLEDNSKKRKFYTE